MKKNLLIASSLNPSISAYRPVRKGGTVLLHGLGDIRAVELRFELRLSRLTLQSSILLLKIPSFTPMVIASGVKMRKPTSTMSVMTTLVSVASHSDGLNS